MKLPANVFVFVPQTCTFVAEASDFGLPPAKRVPQRIELESPQGTQVGEFVFVGPDQHHGEIMGFKYREVTRPQQQPRNLLLVND